MKDRIFFATNRMLKSSPPQGLGDFGLAHAQDIHAFSAELHPRDGANNLLEDAYSFDAQTLQALGGPLSGAASKDPCACVDAFLTAQKECGSEGAPVDILMHIHGFAADLPLCLQRARQIKQAYFEDRDDAHVVSFSWPADSETLDPRLKDNRFGWPEFAYDRDLEAAHASGTAIATAFLHLLTHLTDEIKTQARQVRLTLLAHSMGNQALSKALQALRDFGLDCVDTPLIDHAFLIAADIGHDAYRDPARLGLLRQMARNIHIYYSNDDRPLQLNEVVNDADDRLGRHGPADPDDLPEHVEAIDCTQVSHTALRHGHHQYYRLVPEVIRDIRTILSGDHDEFRFNGRHDRCFCLEPDDDLRAQTGWDGGTAPDSFWQNMLSGFKDQDTPPF